MSGRTPRQVDLSTVDVPKPASDPRSESITLKHVQHHRTGIALAAAGQDASALENFETAVLLRPTYAEAWFSRGMLLKHLGKLGQAYESFAQATILTPLYEAAENNLAVLANAIGQPSTVLTPWPRAPAPSIVDQWKRKVRRLVGLRDHVDYTIDEDKDEAVLRAKLEQSPRKASLALAMSAVLAAEARSVEAALFLRYALALVPWSGEAAMRLGIILDRNPTNAREVKSLALGALKAGSTDERLAPQALWHGLALGEWYDYATLHAAALESLHRQPSSVPPFMALHLTTDPAQHRRSADAFHRVFAGKAKPLNRSFRRDNNRPITLGYLSADFRDHPGARLFTELFELHDRSRFKVLGYSTLKDSGTDIGRRVRASFDRIVDLDASSDDAAARRVADDAVDILVDVTGNAFNGRPGILATRPAPIQVNYLAYAGPSGCPTIDYAIVDKTVVPPHHAQWYSEALVYLPDSYQVNDRKRRIGSKKPSRVLSGLPPEGVVFCCFNEVRKILPDTFAIWMEILRRVPGSVLWLYSPIPASLENLRKEAAARDVDPLRLVGAGRVSNDEHLARYRLADLFLDTQPYGAHTTASDALWVGCPVLTMLGDAFPGRVGASLLKAADMPDMIASSRDEYVALAVRVGMDAAFRNGLRVRLQSGRNACALFDTPRFTRHLEWAYERMWQDRVAGRIPEMFEVPRQ